MSWRSALRRRGWRLGKGAADPARSDVTALDESPARRNVVGWMTGAVAVAVGGAMLADSAPASAATTTEPGAVAPAVVQLTDAPTITVNASQGDDFRVTIAGDRTLGNPSSPTDGQQIIFQVTQGPGGPFTLSYGSSYEFGSGLPQPALSTVAGNTDLLGFIYNAAKGTWLLAAFANGFS